MRIGRNMARTSLNIRADQMDRLKELSSETGVSMAFISQEKASNGTWGNSPSRGKKQKGMSASLKWLTEMTR